MRIYTAPNIKACQSWYADKLNTSAYTEVKDHLAILADRLFEGYQHNIRGITSEFSNYHPEMLGWNPEMINQRGISREDCQLTLARECGYDHWQNISGRYNKIFEHGLNLFLNGHIKEFKICIQKNPHLVNTTSPYGHQATLLHYAASNGVEMWRQQVPLNLVNMVDILLQNGADPEKKMKVYGGYHDVISLLKSSAHPYQAGIGIELEKLILKSQTK